MGEFKIQTLHLYNYRKFADETFTLNPRMNVFAGRNGSGKTAMLEAANVMLGAYLAAFKTYVPSRFVFNISKGDARVSALNAEGFVAEFLKKYGNKTFREMRELRPKSFVEKSVSQYPCRVKCTAEWGDKGSTYFERILEKEGSRTKFGGSNPMQPEVVEWEKQIAKADGSDEKIIMPLVLYLSSARLWNDVSSPSKESDNFPRTDAYSRCLDGKHGMDLAFAYLRRMRLIAVEENNGVDFPAYDAVLKAVNLALKEELGKQESVIFSTRYGKDIVALRAADGTVLPFTALSDGYRNVIKIVLDIAVRMCILNPYLGGKALEQTPGVVIIDELDLSLHPTWQQRIIRILKTLFPKVQFLCATHSPFIIQSLEEGELIMLDKEENAEKEGKGTKAV